MPTYEYRCPAGHDFEIFYRKMSDAAPVVSCPGCGKVAQRRISAGAGLVFKGSGFYITDYGKDGKKDQAARAGGRTATADSGGEGSPGSGSGDGNAAGESKPGDGAPPAGKSGEAPAADRMAAESRPGESKAGASKSAGVRAVASSSKASGKKPAGGSGSSPSPKKTTE